MAVEEVVGRPGAGGKEAGGLSMRNPDGESTFRCPAIQPLLRAISPGHWHHSSNACPEPNSWVRIAILKGARGVREDMEKGGAWISTGGLWPGGSGVESQSVQAQAGPLYVGKASHTRGALVSHRNTE